MPNAALRYRPPRSAGNQGFSITSIFIPRMPRFEKSSSGVSVDGERSLWVLDNGVPREVKVKTGASDGLEHGGPFGRDQGRRRRHHRMRQASP